MGHFDKALPFFRMLFDFVIRVPGSGLWEIAAPVGAGFGSVPQESLEDCPGE
jgi:hypothetical protein